MPVIAYQSLNSNSSTEHSISASNSQYFTRMTHNKQAAQGGRWALSMPTAEGVEPNVPIHGPAELLPSAPQGFMGKGNHDNATFLGMIMDKSRQIHQSIIRQLGPSDVLVYGELNGSHADWASLAQHAGAYVGGGQATKACNSFAVFSGSANVQPIAQGFGWVGVKVYNVICVFVHVPNSIAKSTSAAVRFYQDIGSGILQLGHGAIDLILGDTNQASDQFTPQVVSRALGTPFKAAHSGAIIEPIDTHQRSFGGSNSTASKMYDVAVYNTATIKVQKVAYLSQATPVNAGGQRSVAAVTDHMGIAIKVEK